MRKRIISAYIVMFLASCICSCAQTTENAPVAEMENEEQEDTSTEVADEDETDAADEISESEEQASSVYVIYPQLTQNDTYEMQDWQATYAEYIEGLEWDRACTYSLIYVDDNDIPELVIDSGFEAGGCEILTYHSGEIGALQTDRRLFYYIEKKNLINNTGGAYGYYYDRIYTIENGKWVCIADGEQTEITGEDWVFRYEWDGAEVEEDVYEQNLNAVFDREQGIEPDLYYIMDEMLSLFRTGDVASQNHRYELFVEDITWDEAKIRCEERGGYLATITSTEEYERIQKGIVDSHQTDISFWVGASDNEEVLGQKIFGYGWLEPGKEPDAYCMLNHFNALFAFWEPDEPSYRVEAGGKTIKEDSAYLLYDDTEEKCFLYDAPMDMLSVWPEYAGKIGYICEYDSPEVKDITWEQAGYNVVDLHFIFDDTVIDREM